MNYFTHQIKNESTLMGFTPRDKDILETIYHLEGVLADYQIVPRFFNSERRMKARMSLLCQNGYLDRLTRQQRNSYGFMAYFLSEKGIDYLCNLWGIPPEKLNARSKNDQTFRVRHDVKLNDVRMAIMDALVQLPHIELIEWVNARAFQAHHDTITYTTDGKASKRKIAMQPDGYFRLIQSKGKRPLHLRFLIELDMRPIAPNTFIQETFRPGLAYINSEAYAVRFGDNTGRWLVITTEEALAFDMKRKLEPLLKTLGDKSSGFYFTSFELATTPGAFFTQPIWWRPEEENPVSLIDLSRY